MTIAELMATWRERAASNGAIYASGIFECADELSALLAAAPLASQNVERRINNHESRSPDGDGPQEQRDRSLAAVNLLSPSGESRNEATLQRAAGSEPADSHQVAAPLASPVEANLLSSLEWLANEATGFLAMADPSAHGQTNLNRLQRCIDKARSAIQAAKRAEAPRRDGWMERVEDYIRGAMKPQNIAAAVSETIWDRGRRSGLQEALNAIHAERAKADPPVSGSPEEERP